MKRIAGIPAYNKQYPVCGVIHAAEEYVDEIIVADDGSRDRTSKYAKRAGAVVLRHEINQGKTAAVQTNLFLNPFASKSIYGKTLRGRKALPKELYVFFF